MDMDKTIFHYSQASLQDFADCPRRFYYRYLERLAWPAVESEPVIEAERLMQAGEQFHRLVLQYLSGVPVRDLENAIMIQEDIQVWWQNFLNADIDLDGAELFPEKVLSVRVGEVKLVGKFDLVALTEDTQAVIYDWKTSQHPPSRSNLAARWQTIVYPYLLAKGGEILNRGKPVNPDRITMVYWYSNFPDQPSMFRYSAEDFASDEAAITDLITDIESRSGLKEFQLTVDEKRCKYCIYRSLCDRGVAAGDDLEVEFDSETEIELDFEQVQEIEF
jgi:hypothetical protein